MLAPAKINLGLEILRLRPDGYHDINSVFLPIPLHDTLEFIVDREIALTCKGIEVPCDETNLCYRAADALRRKYGAALGARISLEKNIPVGAGLGGGSSDAAATLLALNEIWGINSSINELHALAAGLGADVPFFLYNSAALVGGMGERIETLDYALKFPMLLVCPAIHISTAWAYGQITYAGERRETPYRALLGANAPLPSLAAHFRNDFEAPVFSRYPELRAIKETLLLHGAGYASLSGSGSALYGLFESRRDAESARRLFPASRVILPA